VVVNYVAAKARALHGWFQELVDQPGRREKPLRMLLLERHADPSGGWWLEAFGTGGWGARAVRSLLDPQQAVPLARLSELAEQYAFLTHMAAYATLCQGLDREICMEAAQGEKDALGRPSAGDPADVADALHRALPGLHRSVEPVLPDMIGEAVILRTFVPLGRGRGDFGPVLPGATCRIR
jgi:hypothetical protein